MNEEESIVRIITAPQKDEEVGPPIKIENNMIKKNYCKYLIDESKYEGEASILFFPLCESHIIDFLKEMNLRKISVTISGGRTGIVGGAVPQGGALLSLEKMNKILDVNRTDINWMITVQPGLLLTEFRKALEKTQLTQYITNSLQNSKSIHRFLDESENWIYAPDPTEETASIGGTVATDASGGKSYRYGSTRMYIERIRVVLTNGDVLDITRGKYLINDGRITIIGSEVKEILLPNIPLPKIKNTAGYMCTKNMDLIDLFIGSEGTLGVISEVTLKLIKKPGNIGTLISYFNSEDNAITFASLLNEDTHILSTEFFDSNSLSLLKDDAELTIKENYAAAILTDFFYKNDLDLEHTGNRLENKLNSCKSNLGNTSLGISESEIEKIHNIRHKLPERINKEIAQIKKKYSSVHKIGTDTAVPQSSFKKLLNNYHSALKKSQLLFVIFGHIGESHIHVNIIPKNIYEFQKGKELSLKLANMAIKLGGTGSAEHGIGKLKRNLLPLMFTKEQIKSMVTIKKLFDPNDILSRGNMFSRV